MTESKAGCWRAVLRATCNWHGRRSRRPSVVERWHNLGIEQAKRLDVEAVIVPVSDRADADDPAIAEMVSAPASSTSPEAIPRTSPTPFEHAVWRRSSRVARRRGARGCSAGAMAMTSWSVVAPSAKRRHARPLAAAAHEGHPSLRLLQRQDPRHRYPIPAAHDPASRSLNRRGHGPGGGPAKWTVQGRQSVCGSPAMARAVPPRNDPRDTV